MHTSSDTSTPAKRSRARTRSDATPKKPRAGKKTAGVEVIAVHADTETTVPAIALPGADELAGQIATAAYFIAAQRNFAPGHELDDWLSAERAVLSRYG